MSSYTIEKIAGKREFDSKHGPLVSYKVEITGDDGFSGIAEITQKPATPPPSGTIEGTLDKSNPQYPPKLKKAQQQGGGKGRPKADEAEIRKAVAYKGAVEIVAALITHGTDRDPEADIERFFHHGLGLLEGKTETHIKATYTPPPEATAPGKEELVKGYHHYINVKSAKGVEPEDARKHLELKKTELGITEVDAATPEQKAKLLAFFQDA